MSEGRAPTRIHSVTLIPCADVGAVFWRVSIDLGDDILGESVQALVAALEDAGSPPKDPEHWGRIAANRWMEPHRAMDDRPLLPSALAATVVLPFAITDDDPMKERHAAAEAWIKDEVGSGQANPFGDLAPAEQTSLVEEALGKSEKDDEPPDANEIDEIADAVLAASRRRHEAAGFKQGDADAERVPEVRGESLEAEVRQRLAAPYQSRRDREILNSVRDNGVQGMDAADILEKLAQARRINPDPPLPWPAFNDREARCFGDAFFENSGNGNPRRHIDIAGAMVVGRTRRVGGRRIEKRRFDGLLAEATAWRNVVFAECEFDASSFCQAQFKDCEFRDCRFWDTNLSKAELVRCAFIGCVFVDLRVAEPSWLENRFRQHTFKYRRGSGVRLICHALARLHRSAFFHGLPNS